ncbi:hypothetical protein [Pyrobaculum calidifontis]|uniref:hypothetical protein n=1 Tax=Pyrobaculum calidifontis TaxID=181486 RepID=UPI00186B6EBC|nr:hypothetical protein [Pyrobaculum calidifontis]
MCKKDTSVAVRGEHADPRPRDGVVHYLAPPGLHRAEEDGQRLKLPLGLGLAEARKRV